MDSENNHEKAGDDTIVEVNTLILDYMLCMAIHEATSGQVQDWAIWLEDTQRMLKLVLPPVETLTPDLRIKTQVFDIIRLFIQTGDMSRTEPTTLADMATALVATCKIENRTTTIQHAVDAAVQICAHAALQARHDTNHDSPGNRKTERQRDDGPENNPICVHDSVSTKKYLEASGQSERDKGTTEGLFGALLNIMMSLEPPVLIQLEKGKLNGLSRAQTEELKMKIGMY
ncbi:hypothetical protein ASPCAL09876 [Aspergillus calidoustus]|uniref:Uncharacterized protein n=1 Tax=Aspergillus calidoustus TaxID=454130 RepID=A0A0U5G4R7_ASPCI|nr:hypothetical protein ASPCAL09876 [Aspergillus calidoustus]